MESKRALGNVAPKCYLAADGFFRIFFRFDAKLLEVGGVGGFALVEGVINMLSKAKEWKLMRYIPEFKLFKETGRDFETR